jgi:hypothetical protein
MKRKVIKMKCIAMQPQIQLVSTIKAPARDRTTSSTVSARWENYNVAGEHMNIRSFLQK